jgi:FkbM family methyltransferase
MTRRLVLKRSLPEEFNHAPLLATSEGGLRYLFRSMEDVDPHLLKFAMDYVNPGNTVWDIGSNIGLFAFAAAARSGQHGKVLCVEADVWLVKLLRETAMLQEMSSAEVEVLSAAAARNVELRTFNVAKRTRSANYLEGYGTTEAKGSRSKQLVLTVSLDWLAEQYPLPQVVKIDVEGAEVEVLEGAREMLAKARPVVACEVAKENAEEVAAVFKDLNYRMYDLDLEPSLRTEHDSPPPNTLAIPAERAF